MAPSDVEAPVVFPIHQDPRTAQALEMQRLEMLQAPKKDRVFKRRMYGAGPTLNPTGGDRFPHTVALRSTTNGVICSGVLVGRRAVMTAQHCVCDLKLDNGSEVHFGLSIGGGPVLQVKQVASFAQVGCPARPDRGRDLALVFLDAPSAPVAPAELASTSRVMTGTGLWVAGFGEQESGRAGEKLTAQIRVVSRNCGTPGDETTYGCAAGREAVLLDTPLGGIPPPGTSDSCYGDSGGPAYLDEDGNGPRLVAIVSRGIKHPTLTGGARCGQGGIYTLIIREVIEWMNAAIRRHG